MAIVLANDRVCIEMDLFKQVKVESQPQQNSYSAKDIEVLEGLEPVRKRPGMYIGGTDVKALYHLISEVLDNSMDEAVAGFARNIYVHLSADNCIAIEDDGRGIPVDPHPKYVDKSALEVILTTLHSGGKFNDKIYATSGGLHGVGVSVVNALTDKLEVYVKRNGNLYFQPYSRGLPLAKLSIVDNSIKGTGTRVVFHPDGDIFPINKYHPKEVYRMLCSKAYLFKGVTIKWSCDESLLDGDLDTPQKKDIHFPNGLQDYLDNVLLPENRLLAKHFAGDVEFPAKQGRVEWAFNIILSGESFSRSYCNTIYTPLGGTHELGFKNAILKGIRNYAELVDNKRASIISIDDIHSVSASMLSIFIKNPSFQGQTKDKLLNSEAQKLVENAIKNSFEHFLAADPKLTDAIIEILVAEAEDRQKRKKSKEVSRKNPIKSLRLPGKLADCSSKNRKGTELFLVEGDSAGGSAKQARNRDFQAILPLKGKILNVASNSLDKIKSNQEISDLIQALGVGVGDKFKIDDLRYEKIIIMTDADVDGAHITSLLLTFFYQQMPALISGGYLYLAQPPLYKLVHANQTYYLRDDKEKEAMLKKLEGKRGQVEIGRFKGLGEMSASQLKETTMDIAKRTLLRVELTEEAREDCNLLVSDLMGKNPEMRFKFIKERTAQNAENLETLIDY